MKFFTTSSLSIFTFLLFVIISNSVNAQYKSLQINVNNDTINRIDKKGLKQGKFVTRVEELRGEPGYEEEGIYKNNIKEGIWRRYTLMGDPIGYETYLHGSKDGVQQYYSPLGQLIREESWKGYNPDSPYDTIPVYGTGSNEIIEFKIVKAEPYSVKNGTWKFYDAETGRLYKTEEWKLNNIVNPNSKNEVVASGKSLPGVKKVVTKTAEMLEWEKKNKGKKNVIRDGKTGM